MKIDGLYELAYRAHSNTSFFPEEAAKRTVEWIEAQLEEDLQKIESESGSTGNYAEKYIDHVKHWLSAKSKVMSWFITGPANFPVARNQKYMNWEDSAYHGWMHWREKYIKAVFRKPTPSTEQDLDDALKQYDQAVQNQEKMKAVNKIIRSFHPDERLEQVMDLGFSDENAAAILKPDCCGDIGFPRYALTNNNAKIKLLKDKMLVMKARIARKESFEPIQFEGGVIDIEDDRVKITHDEKPDRSVIDRLKSRGFRWSRNWGCWCRKHTARALEDAKWCVEVSD